MTEIPTTKKSKMFQLSAQNSQNQCAARLIASSVRFHRQVMLLYFHNTTTVHRADPHVLKPPLDPEIHQEVNAESTYDEEDGEGKVHFYEDRVQIFVVGCCGRCVSVSDTRLSATCGDTGAPPVRLGRGLTPIALGSCSHALSLAILHPQRK